MQNRWLLQGPVKQATVIYPFLEITRSSADLQHCVALLQKKETQNRGRVGGDQEKE